LDYLDLDYGLRGEAEFSFPLYLKRLEQGGDINDIPGCVFRHDNGFNKVPRERIKQLDQTALPAYDLFDLNWYAEKGISAGIFTKRGCAFQCTFCPYSSLEGTRYRLKSPKRVADEIEGLQRANSLVMLQFCDNSFNVPRKHAEAICREMIRRDLTVKWSIMDLKPVQITDDLLRLFKDAGCVFINLALESASDRMLKSMHRGYTTTKVKDALACLERSDIPHSVSLMFGAPGETPETIAETFQVIDGFPKIAGMSVTIGLNLWTHHQQVLGQIKDSDQLKGDKELFDEINYISPQLPKDYMIGLIDSLREKKNVMLQANKPYAEHRWE